VMGSLTVFLGIGRLIPRFAGDWFGLVCCCLWETKGETKGGERR
jgi:hypothetical protein